MQTAGNNIFPRQRFFGKSFNKLGRTMRRLREITGLLAAILTLYCFSSTAAAQCIVNTVRVELRDSNNDPVSGIQVEIWDDLTGTIYYGGGTSDATGNAYIESFTWDSDCSAYGFYDGSYKLEVIGVPSYDDVSQDISVSISGSGLSWSETYGYTQTLSPISLSYYSGGGTGQIVDIVQVQVKTPEGDPAPNTQLSVYDDSWYWIEDAYTDSAGYASLYGYYDYQTYLYSGYPEGGYNFSVYSGYPYKDQMDVQFTADFDQTQYDNGNYVQSVTVNLEYGGSGSGPGTADYVEAIKMRVMTPDNFPAQYVYVELQDSSGAYLESAETDHLGNAYFWASYNDYFSHPEGSYIIAVEPSKSFNFAGNGFYQDKDISIVVNADNAYYDSLQSSWVQSYPEVFLQTATYDKHIKVVMTKASGDPAANLEIHAWPAYDAAGTYPEYPETGETGTTDDYYQLHARTDANGEAYLPIFDDLSTISSYELCAFAPGYSEFFTTVSIDQNSDETLVQGTVAEADATIQVNLVDGTGAPFTISAANQGYADVVCMEINGGYNFVGFFDPGSSSASVEVIAGTYDCMTNIEGYGASSTQASVASGQTTVISSVVVGKNAQVVLRIVDSATGEVITGLNTDFAIWTSAFTGSGNQIQDWANEYNALGQATLSAIGGVEYEAGIMVFNEDETMPASRVYKAAGGANYIIPPEIVTVLASSTEVKTVDFQLTKASASVMVTARDADGNPLTYGWAEAISFGDVDAKHGLKSLKINHLQTSAASDENEDLWSGSPIFNGQAMLYVVADREYEFRIFPPFEESSSSNILPSEAVTLTLQDGESRTIDLQLRQANYTLTISTSLNTSSAQFLEPENFLACSGFDSSGQHTFAEDWEGDGTVQLPLIVDANNYNWKIGCHTVVGSEGDSKYYDGETSYTPKSGAASDSISLVLEEMGKYYPQELYTFDVSHPVSFQLADGETTVEIPAKAIADSGTGIMMVESGKGFTVSEDGRPMIVFDIDFTVDGKTVSETQKPVTIHFKVDSALLAEYGVTGEDLVASRFDETLKIWKPDASYSYDSETETLSVSATHFSLWGSLIDLSKALRKQAPTKPRARKVKSKKKKKKTTMKLCWTAPAGASEVTVYEVDILKQITNPNVKKRKKKNKNWNRAKTSEVDATCMKKKFKAGKYKFRVRVENGTNSSTRTFRVK
jgi:hypothetical protein